MSLSGSYRIAEARAKLLDQNRIVFWNDAWQELYDVFATLSLSDNPKFGAALKKIPGLGAKEEG